MDIQDVIGHVRDIPANTDWDMEFQNEIIRLLEEWEEGYQFDDEEDETEEEE